jgi:hypothetical protein
MFTPTIPHSHQGDKQRNPQDPRGGCVARIAGVQMHASSLEAGLQSLQLAIVILSDEIAAATEESRDLLFLSTIH